MIISETNKYLILFTALLIVLMIPFAGSRARIVHVTVYGSDDGDGSIYTPYASVQRAIRDTYDTVNGGGLPGGDTVYVHEGTYPDEPKSGGYQLYGEPDAWTYLMGVPGEDKPVFSGSLETAAFTALYDDWPQLNHFVLKRLIYRKANPTEGYHCINVYSDDWDEEPVHSVVIDSCEFYNQSQYREMIKMAGVDSFVISNCIINGSFASVIGLAGVGCHVGEVYNNTIDSCLQSGIQFKGGSSEIVIRNNSINMCALNGINMGGDSDPGAFRPRLVDMELPLYEAKEIDCYSNVIVDCPVTFSFDTARECRFYNNLVIMTDSIRVRSETTGEVVLFAQMGVMWVRQTSYACPEPSRNGTVANNIFYFNEMRAGYHNIFFQNPISDGYGVDDQYAGTFKFYNNLWYCFENPGESWKDWANEERWNCVDTTGLNLYAVDPNLSTDPNTGFLIPTNAGILAWKGINITPIEGYEYRDLYGEMYNNPPPIGPINITSEPGAPPLTPLMKKLMPANLRGKQN